MGGCCVGTLATATLGARGATRRRRRREQARHQGRWDAGQSRGRSGERPHSVKCRPAVHEREDKGVGTDLYTIRCAAAFTKSTATKSVSSRANSPKGTTCRLDDVPRKVRPRRARACAARCRARRGSHGAAASCGARAAPSRPACAPSFATNEVCSASASASVRGSGVADTATAAEHARERCAGARASTKSERGWDAPTRCGQATRSEARRGIIRYECTATGE